MLEEQKEPYYVILNMNIQYEICRMCPKSGLFKGTYKECEAWIKGATEATKELQQQIEKMKRCSNCKYGHCGGSSISIDKDGNRTFHNWNEEKQAYCDIGKNGKYQCWELAND